MIYSYGNATPGWKSRQKDILATRLCALIEEVATNETGVPRDAPPYVKVDPQKGAVSIRRLTNLSNNMIDRLTSQADAVYMEVMDLRSSKSGLPHGPIGMSYSEIETAWCDPSKQEIHLECAPGEARPADLIAELIQNTGLPLRDDVSRFFGHWTWDYSDIAKIVWENAAKLTEHRMAALYQRGIIRAGHCGGFTTEESLGI
jgi:hypothetical protein